MTLLDDAPDIDGARPVPGLQRHAAQKIRPSSDGGLRCRIHLAATEQPNAGTRCIRLRLISSDPARPGCGSEKEAQETLQMLSKQLGQLSRAAIDR